MQLKYWARDGVKRPTRGTPLSAGVDLYVPDDFPETLVPPGGSVLIPSGVRFNIPHGHVLVAFNKSGVAVNGSLQVGACVVDEDYTGEVQLHLFNVGTIASLVTPGKKIVQFLLLPIVYGDLAETPLDSLFEGKITERGEGKFGSTGV